MDSPPLITSPSFPHAAVNDSTAKANPNRAAMRPAATHYPRLRRQEDTRHVQGSSFLERSSAGPTRLADAALVHDRSIPPMVGGASQSLVLEATRSLDRGQRRAADSGADHPKRRSPQTWSMREVGAMSNSSCEGRAWIYD